MNTTHHPTRQHRAPTAAWHRGALAAAAALGLAMALPAQADTADEFGQPWLASALTEPAPQGQGLTRAEVRESLKLARVTGMLTEGGEIGDTAAVLQAREDFNALQAEVLETEYRRVAEQARASALQDEQAVARAAGDEAPGEAGPGIDVPQVMSIGELLALIEQSDDGEVLLLMVHPDDAHVAIE